MLKFSFFVFLLFSAINFSIAQTTYYVSTTGDDALNSGTLASPWQTIQKGIDNLTPGDILLIRGGTYPEKLYWNTSGTSGNMITMTNYPGEVVVVDADSFNDGASIFYAENESYYQIAGIHFTNVYALSGSGMLIQGYGTNIEIINNTFSNIAISRDVNEPVNTNTNIPVFTMLGTHPSTPISNVLIQGNEVYNCRPGYSECISLWGNVSNFEISNNTVHDNTNIGIDAGGNYGDCPTSALDHARDGVIKYNTCYNNFAAYSSAAGIYLDGAWDVDVEHNTCFGNAYGIEIGCEESGDCKNINVRNNVLYNNHNAGMALGGYDASTGGLVNNCKVTNNTLYHNDLDGNFNGEFLITQFENSEISNNIIFLSSQDFLMANDRNQPNLTFDYNLVFGSNGSAVIEAYWDGNDLTGLSNIYSTTGTNANSTFGDPIFSNVVSGDFHIATNSPAINAGDPTFTPVLGEVDMDGEARSYGIVDCGADEIQAAMAVTYLSPLNVNIDGHKVSLDWRTGYEENTHSFAVERSANGHTWEQIGQVRASLNSNKPVYYKYLDAHPLVGVNYYRLQAMDLDGSSNFSLIVSVVFEKNNWTVFPNPAKSMIQVKGMNLSMSMDWSYQIISKEGKIMKSGVWNGETILLDKIPSGFYILELLNRTTLEVRHSRFVVE